MSYEAVLLDLDDTLYPYPRCNEAGKRAAFEQARDLGYEMDRESFDERYATARWDVKRDTAETAASHERYLYFKRLLERGEGHSAGDALALGDAYWEGFLDAMAPFDGVEATLADLRAAGVDVAIVTNLTTRIQLEKLQRLGLDGYVDLVWTSEEAGREKPASVMFTAPLARLGHTPGEAVMVGNSVASDVEGGNGVGLTTVVFNCGETGLEGHRRPDHRIDAFGGLREVVL